MASPASPPPYDGSHTISPVYYVSPQSPAASASPYGAPAPTNSHYVQPGMISAHPQPFSGASMPTHPQQAVLPAGAAMPAPQAPAALYPSANPNRVPGNVHAQGNLVAYPPLAAAPMSAQPGVVEGTKDGGNNGEEGSCGACMGNTVVALSAVTVAVAAVSCGVAMCCLEFMANMA